VSHSVTGSQTVGPFFHVGLAGLFRAHVSNHSGPPPTPDPTAGPLTVRGRVIDGDGNGVPDAMIEIWQRETGGFGRVPTAADGSFMFTSVQSPYLNVTIFMRGLLRQLHTRIYFPDDPANDDDPILRLIDKPRRRTLVARRIDGTPADLEWNVILQGEDETVFFDC
jgi:protocatechuate 3,4-dioxygenase alpha subunit